MTMWATDGLGGSMPLFAAYINVDKFCILYIPYWNHLDSMWEGSGQQHVTSRLHENISLFFPLTFFSLRSAMSETCCIPFKIN